MSARVPSLFGVATSKISYCERNIASEDAGRCAPPPGVTLRGYQRVDQALAVWPGSLLAFLILLCPSTLEARSIPISPIAQPQRLAEEMTSISPMTPGNISRQVTFHE